MQSENPHYQTSSKHTSEQLRSCRLLSDFCIRHLESMIVVSSLWYTHKISFTTLVLAFANSRKLDEFAILMLVRLIEVAYLRSVLTSQIAGIPNPHSPPPKALPNRITIAAITLSHRPATIPEACRFIIDMIPQESHQDHIILDATFHLAANHQ